MPRPMKPMSGRADEAVKPTRLVMPGLPRPIFPMRLTRPRPMMPTKPRPMKSTRPLWPMKLVGLRTGLRLGSFVGLLIGCCN